MKFFVQTTELNLNGNGGDAVPLEIEQEEIEINTFGSKEGLEASVNRCQLKISTVPAHVSLSPITFLKKCFKNYFSTFTGRSGKWGKSYDGSEARENGSQRVFR